MRYFSLFSGIGGFELGIQQAYVETTTRETNRRIKENPKGYDEKWQGLVTKKGKTARAETRQPSKHPDIISEFRQPACVGYSEIDKYATQIYQKHFPEHKNYGDITKINEKELPDFDLLVGGFPCQSFSIAGKRRGFADTRGTLFFDIARILKEKQPRLCLLENVKGLLSHDNGNTFKTIITTLDELGYDLQWQVLNSKNFGVPQNRERVLIIGHLRGTPRPQVFPFTEDGRSTDELPRHITNTLTARYEGAQATGSYIGESKLHAQEIVQLNQPKHSNDRVYDSSGLEPTLNTMQGGNRQPFVKDDIKIRRLTPIECERLQGFPDNWTAGVSDTQRYKCCGNAVTVNVIEEIVGRLIAVV